MTNIKEYKIIKEIIPSGAWAKVYIAKYKGKIVALKVLKKEHSINPQVIDSFFAEADSLKNFDDNSIARLIEIGEKKFPYHFAMEYYSGGNLEKFISKTQKISVEKAIKITIQIAKALDKINQKGFLHLDLKPSNILFDKNQRLVLTDFGSAQNIILSSENAERTGTPQYMSPEHFDPDAKLSFSSDLYALGVILYRLVTGKLPFDGDNFQTLSVQHLTQEPIPPSKISKIPKKLNEIVLKLLNKTPKKRYSTAVSLIEDLSIVLLQITEKECNWKIDLFSPKGEQIKSGTIKTLPFTISRKKGSRNNFNISNKLAASDYFRIEKNSNGLIVLKTNIKDDIFIDFKKLESKEEVLLGNENVIFFDNILRITRIPKVKKMYLLLLLFLLMAVPTIYFNYDILSSKISSQIITEQHPLSFSFVTPLPIHDGEPIGIRIDSLKKYHNISKVEIAPFGIRGPKYFKKIQELQNIWTYNFEDINEGTNVFDFGVRLIYNPTNDTTAWVFNSLTVNKISRKIRIRSLDIPDTVKVKKIFNYSFQVLGTKDKNKLYVRFLVKKDNKIITNKNDLLYSELSKRWSFKTPGMYTFDISVYTFDGETSNHLVKNIWVLPNIPPPYIVLKNYKIENDHLIIIDNNKDSVFPDDSLIVQLILNNNVVAEEKGKKGHFFNYSIGNDSLLTFYLKVITPDNRKNYSTKYFDYNTGDNIKIIKSSFFKNNNILALSYRINKIDGAKSLKLLTNNEIYNFDKVKKQSFSQIRLNNSVKSFYLEVQYKDGIISRSKKVSFGN